jgi:FixJ family two-component response regulator
MGQDAPNRAAPLIYVVDDEAIIVTTLAAILAQSEYSAHTFIAPHDALKATQADPPALLRSDVMMPGMSGFDLALGIRKYFSECRVLLFSGAATTAVIHSAERHPRP